MITEFDTYNTKLSDIIKVGDYVTNMEMSSYYTTKTKTIYIWKVTDIYRDENNEICEIRFKGIVWWTGEKPRGQKKFIGDWNDNIKLGNYYDNADPKHTINIFNKKCKLVTKEELNDIYVDIQSRKYNL